MITRNPRISLSRPSSNQWFLHLQRVQPLDRGWYMCQINTDPMVHRSGYFEVQGETLIYLSFWYTTLFDKLYFGTSRRYNSSFKHSLLCISVPPLIMQKDDNADIVAREGDNITLDCDARGHPSPQVVWRREDKEDILVNGRKGNSIKQMIKIHCLEI